MMRVAAVQMRSGTDPHKNAQTFEELVRAAARDGATYVQTPEMTGMVQRDRKAFFETAHGQQDEPVLQRAARLSRELAIHLHVGSTPVLVGQGKAANRAVLFGPDGAPLATYDKIHMFDVDLDHGESWRESAIYQPGEAMVTAPVGDGVLGFSICYDLRFPHLFRDMALAGCNLMAVPAAFTRQTGQAHWHVLLRARAIENGAFVIAAAQGGTHEDGRETYGHSLIIDPWGKVIAEKADDEPGIIIAEIDLAAAAAARAKVPNLKNARPYRTSQRP